MNAFDAIDPSRDKRARDMLENTPHLLRCVWCGQSPVYGDGPCPCCGACYPLYYVNEAGNADQ